MQFKVIILSFFSLITFLIASPLSAQNPPMTDEEFEKEYQKRITKEVIAGVYIPFDIDDAFNEFKRLTEPNDLDRFKAANEDSVAVRLHFGIGRWMIYNWGFYQGSRLSHHLKELGLSFPDDMAQFLIVMFHRKLNNQDLQILQQVEFYQKKRLAESEKRKSEKKVIESFKRKKIQ